MSKTRQPGLLFEGNGEVPFKPENVTPEQYEAESRELVAAGLEPDAPAVQTESPTATLMLRAIQSGAKGDDLKQLMDAIRFADERDAKSEFHQAFTAAQLELKPVFRGKQGHNAKYAPLEDVVAEVRRVFSDHGLSFYHVCKETPGGVTVTAVVSHVAGHSIESTMTAPADTSGNKNAIQSIGSTRSYLKRYTLSDVTGIVTTDSLDNDGDGVGPVIITEEQAISLREMIDSLGEEAAAVEAKMLKWCNAESLGEIPLSKYPTIKARLLEMIP